jgi:Ca2+/Na+ antiporter
MEEYVVIPRNIKVKEIVAYNLNGKQILYLLIGVGGSLILWSLGIPIDFKIAGSVAMISASLFLSLAKAHGQDLDKYIANSIMYPLRTKEWGGENAKKCVLNIRYVLE